MGSQDPADYQVAIPSYRRAVTLASKTLPLLLRRGVDPQRVTVFVASDLEADLYRQTLPRQLYRDLVVAVPGMGAVRNFINRHYPDGQLLVQIDDDIDDVCRADGPKVLRPVTNVHRDVFTRGFTEMGAAGATLWGVYPVANPYFMQREPVSTDLRYVVGALWGSINRHAPHCEVSIDDKEDFERTLRHYVHAGAVVRLNDVTIKTRYYKEPGGMQVTRTEDRVRASAHYLVERYPGLCTINNSKANGMVEIKLRDKRTAARRTA